MDRMPFPFPRTGWRKQEMRRHDIDNLRFSMILLLFPFHAAMVFDGGEFGGFFVWLHRNVFLHAFVTFVYPWFMSLLFVLAGISARYSINKRGSRVFLKERVRKLFLPLLLGMLFLVPVQSYIADLFWNNYPGSCISHLKKFFTTFTYYTGYDGSFTPSHLWFILYLFIYSLLLIPVKALTDRPFSKLKRIHFPYVLLLLLFLLEYLFLPIGNIPSKSIGQYLFLFFAGYYIMYEEDAVRELEKCRPFSLVLFLLSGSFYTLLWCRYSYAGPWMSLLYLAFGWFGILTLLGFGSRYLNYRTKCTAFLSKAAFSFYLLHMPLEVILSYFITKLKLPDLVLFLLITVSSFLATLVLYLLYKRWIYDRFQDLKSKRRETRGVK